MSYGELYSAISQSKVFTSYVERHDAIDRLKLWWHWQQAIKCREPSTKGGKCG